MRVVDRGAPPCNVRASAAWLRRLSRRWMTVAWLTLLASAAQAQFSVSDGGTPSYSQTIGVPPGVAGMSPKLGLFYAGGGVNEPVAMAGRSRASPSSADFLPSGRSMAFKGSVASLASDKLCLDGQRLIQTDASGVPLAFPQTNDSLGLASCISREFRTEKDTYSRIRAYGYANGDATGASGPAYFKVWTKSGQILELELPRSRGRLRV